MIPICLFIFIFILSLLALYPHKNIRKYMLPVRKEVHTRCAFAYNEAEKHLKQTIAYQKGGGNILSCKSMHKFLKARIIYIHYTNEYQITTGLKLSK